MLFKKFIPLFVAISYLSGTLAILLYGPVQFKLHNEVVFWLFIFSYIISFSLGYVLGVAPSIANRNGVFDLYSRSVFYLIISFGLAYSMLVLVNMMMIDLSMFDIVEISKKALNEPGVVYSERMKLIEDGLGGDRRWLNVSSFLFSWMSLLVVCYSIFHWKSMNKLDKLISIIYFIIYILPFAFSGTNIGVFKLAFFLIITYVVRGVLDDKSILTKGTLIIITLMMLPIAYFGNNMMERGGDVSYFGLTAPVGDIEVSLFSFETQSNFLYFTYLWLCYYLVQGYYGFSLILNLDHVWTYGFGSSDFLQRQFLLMTGTDLSAMTYQARIESIWGRAQWHSFFGQMANDISLFGIILFMFLAGLLLARVWLSFIVNRSFLAFALIPIYALMIIFMPANNQVFGYIDTFSYFLFVHIIWFFSRRSYK
jgi:hypothetical protein